MGKTSLYIKRKTVFVFCVPVLDESGKKLYVA